MRWIMKGLCTLKIIAYILVIIGALNWGLIGLFHLDVVAHLLGAGTMATRVVYVLVGLGAVILLVLSRGMRHMCDEKK
jgi:uncharacterized membrane protein YuzA (DUF378 family)